MPYVDVHFNLQGKEIPADHGYHLLSSLSKIVPFLHDNPEIAVHPISGRLIGNRMLLITRNSRLIIRLPSEAISQILPLAGKDLNINGSVLKVGVPSTRALIPSARLYSRLVVIKGFTEPETFLEAAQRQLSKMDVKGVPYLINQEHIKEANRERNGGTHSPYLRRTLKIRDKEIVGFAMGVENLTAEESVLLQEKGIGGRRRFGCGVFIPYRS